MSNEHFAISIDFVKSYDSIDREYLFDVLEKIGSYILHNSQTFLTLQKAGGGHIVPANF